MRTQADIAKGPIDLAVDMDNENWLLIHQKEFEAGIGYHFSEYPWTFAKSVVHALMPKIKELEAELSQYQHTNQKQAEWIKNLKEKLALAEGEWKTYATSCESLSKKLAEANEMLTSSGIDELQNKLKVAEEALEFMKQGCLVPPDGVSPDIPDYINCSTEALKKIEGN